MIRYLINQIVLIIIINYLRLKWASFNPWAVALFNQAWNHYTKTTMYEERTKLDKELKKLYGSSYQGDFACEAFIQNYEFEFFLKRLTFKEKIKAYLLPFSCGDRFKITFNSSRRTEQ